MRPRDYYEKRRESAHKEFKKADAETLNIIEDAYTEMAEIAKGTQYEGLIDDWHKNMTKAIKEAK